MNNKNNESHKRKKNKRKVILQYEDKKETLILTKTVKSRKDTLKIKIQCNTHTVKEVKKISQNEKYPIFRAQLRDRIVPRCLRNKCKTHVHVKTQQCNRRKEREHKKRKCGSHGRKRKEVTPPLIIISDTDSDDIKYDNISSGSLSSYTDDEIDTLMESTRKRMKATDVEWKLMPRQDISTNNNKYNYSCSLKSPSLNSLDTLILEEHEEHRFNVDKLNQTIYSPILSPEKIIKLEHRETSHSKEKYKCTYELQEDLNVEKYSKKNEVEQTINDLNNVDYSSIIGPQKAVKLEHHEPINNEVKYTSTYMSRQVLNDNSYFENNKEDKPIHDISNVEINNNKSKYKSANDSRQGFKHNEIKENQITRELSNSVNSPIISPEKVIKSEPKESNNDNVKCVVVTNECKQEPCHIEYFQKNKDNCTRQLNAESYSEIKNINKLIKLQTLKTENNKTEDQNKNLQNNANINAVIKKLKKEDTDHSELIYNNIDIKQELYSDI